VAAERTVTTLTRDPSRPNPFAESVHVEPYRFDNPTGLARSLEGADTLYNTYWVRFPRGQTSFEQAVENSRKLFAAARSAGVRRIVHISVTNPSVDSPLPYFRGKALVEQAVASSGLSHAIVRPAVIFGDEGIMLNNIAWLLRHFPVFAIPGSGSYRLQPVFVEDLAGLAVSLAARDDNVVMDAVGPETFTFTQLVTLIRRQTGSKALIVHVPPRIALAMIGLVGLLVRDLVLTREEYEGLAANLTVSSGLPTCPTRFSDWLIQNADKFGTRYAPELKRHYT
jgi:NADH dehydrogenase